VLRRRAAFYTQRRRQTVHEERWKKDHFRFPTFTLALCLERCGISTCANSCRSSYRDASPSRFLCAIRTLDCLRKKPREKIIFTDLFCLSHPDLAAFLGVKSCRPSYRVTSPSRFLCATRMPDKGSPHSSIRMPSGNAIVV